MGFRMYQPWEHPRSKVWWFRRRIPVRLVRFGIVAREIKESLHTTDWDEAVLRCSERNLHYERAWRDLEAAFGKTPDQLTRRQIVALAGAFYKEMVAAHRDDPGRPIIWEESLQRDARRKRPVVGGVPTMETLAAVEMLRQHLPTLKVRVINVVDLMALHPQSEHPTA